MRQISQKGFVLQTISINEALFKLFSVWCHFLRKSHANRKRHWRVQAGVTRGTGLVSVTGDLSSMGLASLTGELSLVSLLSSMQLVSCGCTVPCTAGSTCMSLY